MKKTALIILVLSISFAGNTQTISLYKNSTGIYTLGQVDSMLAAMQARIKKTGLDYLQAIKTITGELQNGDTTFYTFTLGAINKELKEQQSPRRDSIVGKLIPPFSFQDINGNKISSSSLKGKPVVLNLWFTTCPPCKLEMPDLNKLKKENPDVIFIAMTFDEKEKVKNFLDKTAFDFIQVTDATNYVSRLEFGYPTTYFIDKAGIVKEIISGTTLTKERSGIDFNAFNNALKKIRG